LYTFLQKKNIYNWTTQTAVFFLTRPLSCNPQTLLKSIEEGLVATAVAAELERAVSARVKDMVARAEMANSAETAKVTIAQRRRGCSLSRVRVNGVIILPG